VTTEIATVAEALGHLNAMSVAKEDISQGTAVDDAEAETVVEADEDDIPDHIPEVTQDADPILHADHVQEIVTQDQEATQETVNLIQETVDRIQETVDPTQEIVDPTQGIVAATIATHEETEIVADHIETAEPGPDHLYLKKYPMKVVPDLDQSPSLDQDLIQKYPTRIMLTRGQGRDRQCQRMAN